MLTRRDMIRTSATGAAILLTARNLSLVAQDKDKEKAVGPFTLPKLPYAFDALEPHIDAKTMEIHHDKHHKTYVDNLNKFIVGTGMETKTVEEILANLGKLPEKVRGPIRNNAGGHYNHTLFWQMMSAKGGAPTGAVAKAVDASFTDADGMFKALREAALARFGSGWAWVVSDRAGKLKIVSTPNQDNTLMDGTGTPILGIDVWEHAYYLKFQNRRAEYIDSFFKVINWDFVGSLYTAAVKV